MYVLHKLDHMRLLGDKCNRKMKLSRLSVATGYPGHNINDNICKSDNNPFKYGWLIPQQPSHDRKHWLSTLSFQYLRPFLPFVNLGKSLALQLT